MFELECDVLVPGARPDSITSSVAELLRWTVVAPAANVPYGAAALEVLHRRGVIAVPDFIANSGGVHLYMTVAQASVPEAALAVIESVVRDAVSRTLHTAAAREITPLAAALGDARTYLAEETGASGGVLDELVPV